MAVRTLIALLVALPAGAGPRVSLAQPTEQVRQLNAEAMAAFEAYAYRKGEAQLEQALEIGKAGAVDKALLARTHVLLGVGAVAGRNDLYRGMHYFVRALRRDGTTKVPKKLLTPQLVKVFASAKRAIKALGRPPRLKLASSGRAKPVTSVDKGAKGLQHVPIDEARRGLPIPVKVTVGRDIRVQRVYLYYRAAGKVSFTKVEMKRRGNVYRAKIPPAISKGRYVHYYVEGTDPRGRVAAHNGSLRGPNVVTIK